MYLYLLALVILEIPSSNVSKSPSTAAYAFDADIPSTPSSIGVSTTCTYHSDHRMCISLHCISLLQVS